MERFKVAMGFPMLAAAIWLYNLAVGYYGERTWWLAIFLVFVAVAAWLFGEFFQRHQTGRGLAGVVIVLVLASGYAFALEMNLRWREPAAAGTSASLSHQQPGGLAWSPWSSAAVTEARRQGRPVVVDFTAKWCLTCNTIVKPALESDAVRKKIAEVKAVPLIADYTRLPDNITRELHRFDRAGVPLVVVFPGKASGKPIVLPEAITPGMVVEALEKAAQ
jgi:thiol:disulfide interchange protein DsbD